MLPRISAVIPIFGQAADLARLLDSLRRQTLAPGEIIVVDSSPHPLVCPPAGVVYVANPEDTGLAGDINLGARHASGDYLLVVQQDCLPPSETTLAELFGHMTPSCVAVACTVTLPRAIWDKYNFWGKVLMARWVGDVNQGISDKFDLYRRDVFLKVGGYDDAHFSAGGQDQDICLRLQREGEVCVAPTRILHLHNQSRKTSWREIFTKTYQLAESFGVLFRRWGFDLRNAPYAGHWSHHLTKYLYPVVALVPFYPKTALVVLAIGTNLSNFAVWKMLRWRGAVILGINPLLFLVAVVGTLKGLASGRQQYSQDKASLPVPS